MASSGKRPSENRVSVEENLRRAREMLDFQDDYANFLTICYLSYLI